MFLAPRGAPDYKNPVALEMNGNEAIVAYGALTDAHVRALAVLRGERCRDGRRSGGGGATVGPTSRLPRMKVEVLVPSRSRSSLAGPSKRRQVNEKSRLDETGSVVARVRRRGVRG